MAFGTLATVNGIGDFASSLIGGLLWTVFGTASVKWLAGIPDWLFYLPPFLGHGLSAFPSWENRLTGSG